MARRVNYARRMRKTVGKLHLSTETIRSLAERELSGAAGGNLGVSGYPYCNPIPTTVCTMYFTCVPKTFLNCY